jgi:hypothetical protein
MTSDILLALTLPAIFVYTAMKEYYNWREMKASESVVRLANRLARAQGGLRL